MVDISFENDFEKAARDAISDSVSTALASVRCPKHGQRPKVRMRGQKIDKLRVEIEGCCDELIDLATKALE